MRSARRHVVAALAALLVAAPAAAQQARDANAHQWWDLKGMRAWRVDQPLLVESISDNTFFSTTVFFDNTRDGAYMGLQQLTGGQRLAIFSIWGATSATPGTGAHCEPFGGEGTGQHCLLPLTFPINRWTTLRMTRVSRDLTGTVWSASVVLPSGARRLIGRIKAPRGSGDIYIVDSFDEYFGPAKPCNAIPKSSAVFGAPRLNGAATSQARLDSSSVGSCSGGKVTPSLMRTSSRLRLGD